MKSKLKPTEKEKQQASEILQKFKSFMRDGKPEAAKEYLLKMRHELRNTNG